MLETFSKNQDLTTKALDYKTPGLFDEATLELISLHVENLARTEPVREVKISIIPIDRSYLRLKTVEHAIVHEKSTLATDYTFTDKILLPPGWKVRIFGSSGES